MLAVKMVGFLSFHVKASHQDNANSVFRDPWTGKTTIDLFIFHIGPG